MLPSQCRVLIVEDEFTIAMDLAAYVENLGCEPVGPAGSVPQALVLAEREQSKAQIGDGQHGKDEHGLHQCGLAGGGAGRGSIPCGCTTVSVVT